MSANVDVVVVGGGPAGCAAALTLRAAGHSVAIIDGARARAARTEVVVPSFHELLSKLGAQQAGASCEPCFGIDATWGDALPTFASSVLDPRGHAWLVHRDSFDDTLRTIARERGVDCVAARARTVAFDDDQVTVSMSALSVRARFLIAATGSPTWPAAITKQSVRRIDSLISCWSTLPCRLTERVLTLEAITEGWWYLCPGPGDTAVAGLVTDVTSVRATAAHAAEGWNQAFAATRLSTRVACKPITSSPHVERVGVGALSRPLGRRWVAVGDAAVQLDPLGSSGLPNALHSGLVAARAVHAALAGDMFALEQYERRCSALFATFARQRDQQYGAGPSATRNPFWARRARTRHQAQSPRASA